jgi:hypothetical protein
MMAATLDALEAARPIIRSLLLAIILLGLWAGLKRTQFDHRTRVMTWLAIALALMTWFAVIWQLAQFNAFRTAPDIRLPAIPLAIAIPVVTGLILLTRSQRVATLLATVPPSWLIGIQVFRVFGFVFLVRWAHGQLPGAFALPAGTGDVLVGLLALPVALYVQSGARGGRAAAYAWNVLGITDFVVAVTMGTLTSPGRLQLFALDQPNSVTGDASLVLIPAFFVPLFTILHGLSLCQLKRAARPGDFRTAARA